MFCCRMVLFAAVITLLTVVLPTLIYVSAAKRPAYTFSAENAQEASFKNRDLKAVALEEILAASNSSSPNLSIRRYKNRAGEAQTRPCCVSSGPLRLDCFVQGTTARLQWINIDVDVVDDDDDGDDDDWETLEGTILGDIECVSRDDGIIDVLARDETGMLMDKTYMDDTWSEWKIVGGPYMEVPSCVARTPTIIDCMGRLMNNALLQHLEQENGDWKTRDSFQEWVSSPLACTSKSSEDFDCFGSREGMRLYAKWWTSGIWSPREIFVVQGHERPSVTSWKDSPRTDVFAKAVMTKGIVHITLVDKVEQQPWEDLGGVFDSVPECVAYGDGLIYCFAVGEESYLYFNSLNLDGWSGWSRLAFFQFLETPSCVLLKEKGIYDDDDYIVCTGRSVGQEVIQITYDLPIE